MAVKKTTAAEEVVETSEKVTVKVYSCVQSAQVKRASGMIETVFAGQKVSLSSADKYNEKCFKEVEK